MSIVVFEDPICELLAPITTGRLAATITCGSYRLLDLLESVAMPVYGISRSYLEPIQAVDFPNLKVLNELTQFSRDEGKVRLLLNARIAPTEANRQTIRTLLSDTSTKTSIIRDRDTIAAVVNPSNSLSDLAQIPQQGFNTWLESQSPKPLRRRTAWQPLWSRTRSLPPI